MYLPSKRGMCFRVQFFTRCIEERRRNGLTQWYDRNYYENFYRPLTKITFDELSNTKTKSVLKLYLNSIDDFGTAIKVFDETDIEYLIPMIFSKIKKYFLNTAEAFCVYVVCTMNFRAKSHLKRIFPHEIIRRKYCT